MPYCHILTQIFSTSRIDTTIGTLIPLTIYDELGQRSLRLAGIEVTAEGILAWKGRPPPVAASITPEVEDAPGEGEEWPDFLAEEFFADPLPSTSAGPSTSVGPSTSASLSIEDRLARLEVQSVET